MPPWTALPVLLASILLPARAARAGPPPCVLRSPLADGRLRVEASDGRELLSATWAPRAPAGLSDCSASAEPRDVAAFLGRCGAVEGRPEPASPGWAEAQAACSGGPARRRAKRGFTYPGTLWCGAGDIAESYEALGEHQETDRCCREHDHCPHLIYPFTYKYGYRNLRFHTISHCECDNRLKACLRAVNDTASRVVGQAFFNIIQVPCFEFTYREQCVEPYLYVWCKNYSTVAVAEVQEPVLYDHGGKLIDGPATRPPGLPSTAGPPDSRFHPTASSAAAPRKPGQAVEGMATIPAPAARPSGWPKKHRKGKAQGKERKGKKGKGKKGKRMKKKKQRQQKAAGAKADALALPAREENAVSPKWLAAQELGKMDFQAPARLPDLGEEDPFNAILSDDPGGGGDSQVGEGRAQPESEEPSPPKASSASGPSSVQPSRKRKGRKRRLQEKEWRQRPAASRDSRGSDPVG